MRIAAGAGLALAGLAAGVTFCRCPFLRATGNGQQQRGLPSVRGNLYALGLFLRLCCGNAGFLCQATLQRVHEIHHLGRLGNRAWRLSHTLQLAFDQLAQGVLVAVAEVRRIKLKLPFRRSMMVSAIASISGSTSPFALLLNSAARTSSALRRVDMTSPPSRGSTNTKRSRLEIVTRPRAVSGLKESQSGAGCSGG